MWRTITTALRRWLTRRQPRQPYIDREALDTLEPDQLFERFIAVFGNRMVVYNAQMESPANEPAQVLFDVQRGDILFGTVVGPGVVLQGSDRAELYQLEKSWHT